MNEEYVWKDVSVVGFDELMQALERADRKGCMPDAVKEAWEAFNWKPAQQGPVAHRDDFWCADLTCKKCYSADFRFKHKNSVVNESLTTPAQRTWVNATTWRGLTDDEVMEIAFNFDVPSLVVRTVEAKLKEKNT